jgi:hypothetical protein
MVESFAKQRMMKHKMESEVLRSGTERGMNKAKTTKPRPEKPKASTRSKVIKKT